MKSADVKRMVVMDSDRTGIRKKATELIVENKITKDEQIQIGSALESLTTHSGWAIVESYIFRHANKILVEESDSNAIAETRGLIKLVHYINNMIGLKNELVRGANEEK